MRVLIGNTVKTDFADYICATREEAETLFMALRDREQARDEASQEEPRAPQRPKGRRDS